jgi:hypothetical protein
MSVYSGQLTKQVIAESAMKIRGAFPSLPLPFFDVFADRIKDNQFTDERLKASINHVIDNCVYPSPTIAQFLSYDKRVKLYSYNDMLKMTETNAKAFEQYKSVRIGEATKPLFALIADIDNYNLQLWNK